MATICIIVIIGLIVTIVLNKHEDTVSNLGKGFFDFITEIFESIFPEN
jgi:hypothetical protein